MSSFDFKQETPSTTWTIVHGLQAYPVVDTYVNVDGHHQKILPISVEAVDANTTVVRFTDPQSGGARLMGTAYYINFPVETHFPPEPQVPEHHFWQGQ